MPSPTCAPDGCRVRGASGRNRVICTRCGLGACPCERCCGRIPTSACVGLLVRGRTGLRRTCLRPARCGRFGHWPRARLYISGRIGRSSRHDGREAVASTGAERPGGHGQAVATGRPWQAGTGRPWPPFRPSLHRPSNHCASHGPVTRKMASHLLFSGSRKAEQRATATACHGLPACHGHGLPAFPSYGLPRPSHGLPASRPATASRPPACRKPGRGRPNAPLALPARPIALNGIGGLVDSRPPGRGIAS